MDAAGRSQRALELLRRSDEAPRLRAMLAAADYDRHPRSERSHDSTGLDR